MTVCVGICTYNGAKYIRAQLESILNQTVKVDQIVISDDASTDNTVEIVKDVLVDSGVDYIISVNEKNQGLTKNGSICNSLLSGDIVIVCDQDNVWEPNLVEKFKEFFSNNKEAVYAFCNGYVTDKDLNIVKPIYDDKFMSMDEHTRVVNALTERSFPHGNTVALKRSFLNYIMPYMFYCDEWQGVCAFTSGYGFGSIDEKLVYFRRHENTLSNSEKTDNKKSPLKGIFYKKFDEHFAWPYHQYKAYEKLLSLFKDTMKEEYASIVLSHMNFSKELSDLREYNIFQRENKIIKLYKKGDYRNYRGNRNTLFMDMIFLFIKQEKRWKLIN